MLSDILDRRRLLIFVQLLLASVSGTLLLLSHNNLLTVDYLIALTFVGGIGAALMGPAWQEIVPALGAWAAYGVDVLSYVFVLAALLWWKRPQKPKNALQEHFFAAFRAGMRYVKASRELHRVLLRAAVYFAFASAIWALLPLVARNLLQSSAGFYGIMLGVSWIIALTTLNGVAQAVLPDWVRGRGLSVYLMVFNGAMAAGSPFWGLVASQTGLVTTLLLAGAALLFWRLTLPGGEDDLQPSGHWDAPVITGDLHADRGPVMIQIYYQVAAADRPAFLATIRKFPLSCRRDGAYAWGIAEHSAEPETLVEWFLVESWQEHLRQHQRVSLADAELQREVTSFHRGDSKPVVHHLLSVN